MSKTLWFTKREAVFLVVVGLLSSLVDHRVEIAVFQSLFNFQPFVNASNNLYTSTGGPILGDLLMTWEQYGGVLAAFVVRKPGAGTFAMTVNGFGQVFLNGTHTPHLLYGVAGLGADVVFAAFKYSRYDLRVSALAGVASGMFWYPVVYFSHAVYQFPLSFIIIDLTFRAIGNAVGNGLLGAGLGVAAIAIAKWLRGPQSQSQDPTAIRSPPMPIVNPMVNISISEETPPSPAWSLSRLMKP